jgi:hypothetical protein
MVYEPQSRDTSSDVDRLLVERWRRMPPWRKLEIAGELSDACRELARAGIRQRHPGASEREVHLRLAALSLDRDTMVRVFAWDPEAEGY